MFQTAPIRKSYESMRLSADDLKFKHPVTIVVAGATKAGKSSFIEKLLKAKEQVFDIPPQKILYCYGAYDRRYLDLMKHVPNLELFHGLPTEYIENPEASVPSLIVLDDLIESSAQSKLIAKLFMQTSHHNNLSVILVTQNIFYQGSQFRNIMKNAGVIILMNSLRDRYAIQILSRQIFPKTPNLIYDAYEDAMKERYGYLVLNLDAGTDERLRVTKGILPEEEIVIYLPK